MIETSIVSAVAQAAKPLNKGIPGVPLHALDAVPDENTRQVLRAIVDGWHVRNGSSGAGDNRFVTARELDAVNGRLGGVISETRSLAAAFEPFGPGQINRLIDDLHSQVFESRLFKALEQRVDLIDKPGGIFDRLGIAENAITSETELRIENDEALASSISAIDVRLGDAEALILEETELRVNGDTALATSLSALGVKVGDAEAAIVSEATARANADNAILESVSTQFSSVNESLSLVQTATSTNANSVSSLSTTLTQVQASVGDLSSAIAAEATARADADGTLYAQYTLRIDVNGRVSGFGLASDENSSDFIIRADRFSIVSPDGQNRAALIMTNNTIVVYDQNGIARVRIGKLT